jgi:hypothetical protein
MMSNLINILAVSYLPGSMCGEYLVSTAFLLLIKATLPPFDEDKWGSGGLAPPFLISVLNGSGRFTAGERAPVAVWAPEPVWTLWRREEISCRCRDSNPDHPARNYSDWAVQNLFNILNSSWNPSAVLVDLVCLDMQDQHARLVTWWGVGY